MFSDAKKARAEHISQNQIYRLAAMWYRTKAADITDAQFEFVRFWFSIFSALAVALAGTVAALVYYAKDPILGRPLLLAKLVNAGRAYYARKRKTIYRDGKEPPTIVKEEVVKWIDRIVLIPRWGLRAPIYVNSLIKDEPNVAALKRAN